MSASLIPKLANIASIAVNLGTLEGELEKGLEEGAEEEDDSDDEPEEKPRLSKRQCSHMDSVAMRINGRYLCNGKRAYDQDTLRNSGNYPEPSLAPASLVNAVDSAGETPQPLTDSTPAETFESALQLKGLLFDGNPDSTYVAVAPTAIASTSPVEDLETFLMGIGEGFAIMSPLILVALLWLVIVWRRANKQRRALASIEHEPVEPYPSPVVVEIKGDLESGSL